MLHWERGSWAQRGIAHSCGADGHVSLRAPRHRVGIGTTTRPRDIRPETDLATEWFLGLGGWLGKPPWGTAGLSQHRNGVRPDRGLEQAPHRSCALHADVLQRSQSRIEDHQGYGNDGEVGWTATRHSQRQVWPPKGRALQLHTRCSSQSQCGRVVGGRWRFDSGDDPGFAHRSSGAVRHSSGPEEPTSTGAARHPESCHHRLLRRWSILGKCAEEGHWDDPCHRSAEPGQDHTSLHQNDHPRCPWERCESGSPHRPGFRTSGRRGWCVRTAVSPTSLGKSPSAPGRIRTCVKRIRSPLPTSARPPGLVRAVPSLA